MLQLAQLSGLDERLSAAKRLAHKDGLAWVVGYNGDGRSTVAAQLAREEDAVLVLLPPLSDPDAPLHGLLQAAGAIGGEAVDDAATDSTPLEERARSIGRAIAEKEQLLVVLLPDSWGREARHRDSPDAVISWRRARELLSGWLQVRELRLVLVSSRTFPLGDLVSAPTARAARVELARCLVDPKRLPDPAGWGSYADAASRFGEAVDRRSLRLSPLQFRLGVAAVGLGEGEEEICRTIEQERTKGGLWALERRLCSAFDRPANERLRLALWRFLQARAPLPRAELQRVAQVSDDDLPLLTECVGYGEPVRTTEAVRLNLVSYLRDKSSPSGVAEQANLTLADYHERLDGAASPRQAGGSLLHWLEKAHHLAHGGLAAQERWNRLELTAREHFWDRARALSIGQRAYAEAAEVYRACLTRVDRDDDYSWHYLAWNLDRAGQLHVDVERGFRRAVELDPDNAWWNSRLVTYLIRSSRFRAADDEWEAAIDRLDREGGRLREDAWLALHVHRRVVEAWLDAGEVARAAAVLRSIPDELVEREEKLWALAERVSDAEEALQLGESVYPRSVRREERWSTPRLLPAFESGSALRSWFPGRVTAAGAAIVLALATRDDDRARRRLLAKELGPDEATRLAGGAALRVGDFVELGIYENEAVRLVVDEPTRRGDAPPARRRGGSLRHLKQWTRA